MTDAKIEIKVGAVSFTGEGDGKWLSEQLDKVLEKLPELANVASSENSTRDGEAEDNTGVAPKLKRLGGTLAGFLAEKKAKTNQVRKFLATAVWLEDHDSKETVTTTDVTKALSDSKQSPLRNPSQCLAVNVSKGFCQKDSKNKRHFFVTDEGRDSLG